MKIASPRSTDSSYKPASILMVDDNPHGLAARKSILEELGYEMTICGSPQEALDRFSSSSFDLVITDYRMPSMNGAELIAKLKQLSPSVPVILVSGFVEALGLTEENTNSDAVIQKSSNEVQQLVRAVGRVLRRKTPKKPNASATGKPLSPRVRSKGAS